MDYVKIADKWRKGQPAPRARTGVVLIWNGEVYGWKDKLRDAHHEQPGAVAVTTSGRVFIAEGGDPHNGAKIWAAASVSDHIQDQEGCRVEFRVVNKDLKITFCGNLLDVSHLQGAAAGVLVEIRMRTTSQEAMSAAFAEQFDLNQQALQRLAHRIRLRKAPSHTSQSSSLSPAQHSALQHAISTSIINGDGIDQLRQRVDQILNQGGDHE